MNDWILQEMAEAVNKIAPNVAVDQIKEVLAGCWEDKAAIVWCVDDVQSDSACADMGLTEEQAKEVLHSTIDNHDATLGINWLDFRIRAICMF